MKRTEFSEHMSYDFLDLLRKQNPAWRLLASPQAPFVASFLYKEFIAEGRRQIAEHELAASLEHYAEQINQGREEGIFPGPGRKYLELWTDDNHGWLRKFYPAGEDEPYFDLTSLAQKAVEWLLSLKPQEFIGTESRLITVFQLLQQIIEGTERDPQRRLTELERRQQELQQEILRLEKGEIALLDKTQIKERFSQAMSTAWEILSDFRAVEQNFRELDRSMREQIATWDEGKGRLLEAVFEEKDGIGQSEQGKSFAAFWRFLMSPAYQEDFEEILQRVLELEPVQEMSLSRNVRYIHHEWVDAGAHVQATVAALSQQLRRYVDESFLEEERRINQVLREIEGKALALRQNPPKAWWLAIDGISPDIALPMDRPLFSPPRRPEIRDDAVEAGQEDISAEALFSQIYVDKEALKGKIDYLLQHQKEITLSQVIEQYPLELGLSELVTYLTIASEGDDRAVFDNEALEEVAWQDEMGKEFRAKIPRIMFRRV